METLLLPNVVREKLGESASKSLIEMFVDAHRLSTVSFEQRLAEELTKVRFEIAHARSDMTNAVSNLKFDLLKWCFLFWIGQLAAMTAILGLLLQRVR